jgi:Holliday junction resolvase RusA-like endonuclease
MIEIILPLPPSANRMWRRFGNRTVMAPEYREWKSASAESIAHQIGGMDPLRWYSLAIVLPPSRIDPDNRLKALNDALQAGGAIVDDKHMRCLVLTVDDDRADRATALLQLREAAEPVKQKKQRKRA